MSNEFNPDDLPQEVTVTMRVEDMPDAMLFDSSTDECDQCGAAVWVSQATQAEIKHGVYPDAIVCTRCATDDE